MHSKLRIVASGAGETCGYPRLASATPLAGHPDLMLAPAAGEIGRCGQPATFALVLGKQRLPVCDAHLDPAVHIARKVAEAKRARQR